MSDVQILWSYPLVFHRVRRVDSRYAYLVVKDGYLPLRRCEGCLSVVLPYVKYVSRRVVYASYGYKEYGDGYCGLVLETLDDISSFFQTQMENEYLSEEQYDVCVYGKLWDRRFDELYGMHKHVKEYVEKKREKERVNKVKNKHIKTLEELYKKS